MTNDSFCARYERMLFALARRVRAASGTHVEIGDLVQYGIVGALEARARLMESEPPRVPERVVVCVYARSAMLDGLHAMTGWRRRVHAIERDQSIVRTEAALARNATTEIERGHHDALHEILTESLLAMAGHVLAESHAEPDPELRAVRQHMCGHILAAVDRLDDPYRRIIYDRYFENRSNRELAAELGLSERYTSQLHQQAITLLRAPLSELSSALVYARGSLAVNRL
jgi:RNA polymerase sigma factor (sigma-70 family)